MDKCAKYQEMISALLDGELSAEEREALHAHMAECPDCRRMHEAFAAIAGAEELEEAPEGMLSGAMFKIRNPVPQKKKHPLWKRYAAAAACLVVALVGATQLDFRMGASSAAPADCAAPSALEMMDVTEDSAYYAADYSVTNGRGAAEASVPAETSVPADTSLPAPSPMPAPEEPKTEAGGTEAPAARLWIRDENGSVLFETADAAVMAQLTVMLTESGTGYNVLVEYENGTAKAFVLAVNAEELETLLNDLA